MIENIKAFLVNIIIIGPILSYCIYLGWFSPEFNTKEPNKFNEGEIVCTKLENQKAMILSVIKWNNFYKYDIKLYKENSGVSVGGNGGGALIIGGNGGNASTNPFYILENVREYELVNCNNKK